MDNKTKDGLIASGVVLGLLGLLYLIFKPKSTTNIINQLNPNDKGGLSNVDPYSLVDKYQKLKEIKKYVADQAGYDPNSDFNKNQVKFYAEHYPDMEWQPYWWPDANAYSTDNGINAWYAAIKQNKPTFSFYVDGIRKNYECTTKDGKWNGTF
jgi:hypothetical protein